MAAKCNNISSNMKHCNCSYEPCDKKGNCCACIQYHLNMKELPSSMPKETGENGRGQGVLIRLNGSLIPRNGAIPTARLHIW